MSSTLPLLVENFAPWLTAVGAIVFGVLSHRRSSKSNEHDAFQKQLEQLHGLYHTLTGDLSEQVERLSEQNEKLSLVNSQLLSTVEELNKENNHLKRTIKTLTAEVRSLKRQVGDLDASA